MKTHERPTLNAQRSTLNVCPACLLIAAHFLLNTGLFAQGPLTPPGPPGPTLKTLQQIEPRTPIGTNTTPGDADSLFKITQPGSYYLTGNITGVSNKVGIEIASSGVTLDLMGFELTGVDGSADGIWVSIAATNIAIRNGSVRNWGSAGIYATLAVNSQFQGLRAANNSRDAGILAGAGSTVNRCSVDGNGDAGILTGSASIIIGCTVQNNAAEGIHADSGSTIRRCAATGNRFDGIYAIASIIEGCTATLNGFNGILANGNCTVRDNTCSGNGTAIPNGAGIEASSSNNCIDSNNVINNDRGIHCSAGGNIILRNTASGNTGLPGSGATADYDFSDSDTTYGPIVTKTSGGLTTINFENHPWANFRY